MRPAAGGDGTGPDGLPAGQAGAGERVLWGPVRGVYAVYDREENRVTDETLTESGGPNTIQVNRSSFWSSDNPLLTELGTEDIDLGKYGVHALPRLMLIGQYDEEKHEYTFPGLPGYSLFSTTTYEEAGAPCTSSVSDMAEASFRLSVTDNGTTDEMEGTLYMGPPADAGPHWDPLTDADGVWTFYRVYQAPDGTVYLDGGGDSFRGGGGFSTTQTATQKTTDSEGQVTEETVSVRVSVEAAPRLTQLAVSPVRQRQPAAVPPGDFPGQPPALRGRPPGRRLGAGGGDKRL